MKKILYFATLLTALLACKGNGTSAQAAEADSTNFNDVPDSLKLAALTDHEPAVQLPEGLVWSTEENPIENSIIFGATYTADIEGKTMQLRFYADHYLYINQQLCAYRSAYTPDGRWGFYFYGGDDLEGFAKPFGHSEHGFDFELTPFSGYDFGIGLGKTAVFSSPIDSDEQEETDYMLVKDRNGLPLVVTMGEKDGNPQVIYWCDTDPSDYDSPERRVQDLLRQHLKDYTAVVSNNKKFTVRFRSELLPQNNEEDWTKGVVTGMIGATLRMANATYEFSSAAARKQARSDDWLPSFVLTTEQFVADHPILPFKHIYDDEDNIRPLPANIVRRLEQQYGLEASRSELGYEIAGKYRYGVVQFEPKGNDMLALEVLTDGKDIWTLECMGNCSDGIDSSVWNVDDGGEYFISHLVAAFDYNGYPVLFFTRGAPESMTPGWMTVKDGKLLRATQTSYYVYYD